MPAEQDFMADPVGFMRANVIRPIIHGFGTSIQTFKFTEDTDMVVRRGSFHWYREKLRFYKVEPSPTGAVRAYVLGYKDDQAVGNILGVNAADPQYMFTYRMDGCSLGFAQAGPNAGAYVSHHNDKTGGNVANTIEHQPIAFADLATPAMNFAHKSRYMTDSKGNHNMYYKSSTVGVRDAGGTWRFYLQVRKYHGTVGDKNLSLKGVVAINP